MTIEIDDLKENDWDRGDAIFRTAFATFLGTDPVTMFGDSDLFRTRCRAGNTRVLAARRDGTLVGSNVLTRWGKLGWFGPLTVTPELWDQGVAKALMEATERVFDEWGVSHRALFTFAQSGKHLGLYQRFGYWPGPLTPILDRTVVAASPQPPPGISLFSERPESDQGALLREIRELGDGLLPGLDLTSEVESARDQGIGETVLLRDGSRLAGYGVCYLGPGGESRHHETYVKFAAVSPGSGREHRVRDLLSGLEWLGASRESPEIGFGCNLSHRETYRALVARGYRAAFVGVAMVSGPDTAYLRPELDVLDDWR